MLPDDEFEREHPSYGLVRIARMSGGSGVTRLFGSPLANHYGTIRISIGSAKWIHGLGRDRYFGSLRGEHVEVEMSAAQFADMITSLNIGEGTPCTVRYVGGQRLEDPPLLPTEAEHIRDNFAGTLGKYKAKVSTYRKRIEELTGKLATKAKEEIRIALDVIEDQLSSNVPFMLKQFQEATTKVSTAAKAEVEAFVSSAIRVAGLSSIAEGRLPALLPSGEGSEQEP